MLGDNMSVVLNTTVPSSPLKKKHQSCNYHRIREAIAAKIVRFAHVSSGNNLADLLTKPVTPATHQRLVKPWLFRSPPFGCYKEDDILGREETQYESIPRDITTEYEINNETAPKDTTAVNDITKDANDKDIMAYNKETKKQATKVYNVKEKNQ